MKNYSQKGSAYIDVRNWLENFIPLVYGKEELGLLRIENLLEKLGNPQKKFKSILVGGTAGKGSTAYYIARLLQCAGPVRTFPARNASHGEAGRPPASASLSDKSKGDQKNSVALRAVGSPSSSATRNYKIGLHLSPHLIYIGERMQILGNKQQATSNKKQKEDDAIPVKRLVSLANQIKPVVDAIGVSQPELLPSYFEILVALSFLYFAKEKVDFAVVEVGLGGRLDATNILQPEICVITNVGLDHTEILGDTIEKIAREKAGIIKTSNKQQATSNKKLYGVPVVTGITGKALKVIKKVAKSKNALLINLNTLSKNSRPETDIERYIARYYYPLRCHGDSFASRNKNLALLTVLSLGIVPDPEAVKKAFSVGFDGRFEEIAGGVILDGAHNPDKIKALIQWIKSSQLTVHGSQKIILVVAFKKGKNWQEMIDLLMKNLPIKKVIATEYKSVADTGLGSSVDAEEIADYVESKWKVKVESISNSQEAVVSAQSSNKLTSNQLVLVTGSLYLVGEVRTLWKLPEF